MAKLGKPVCRVRWVKSRGWEVWSETLRSPIRCNSPVTAKLIAQSLVAKSSPGMPVDYSEVDLAIDRANAFLHRRQKLTA